MTQQQTSLPKYLIQKCSNTQLLYSNLYYMGGKLAKQNSHYQLAENNPSKIYSDNKIDANSVCCAGVWTKKKKQNQISVWKINFNKNALELQNNGYKWINPIIQVFRKFNKQDRPLHLKQFDYIRQEYLRRLKCNEIPVNNSKQDLSLIKKGLHTSVIFQEQIRLNTKERPSVSKKSNYQFLSQSILINRQTQTKLKKKRKDLLISFMDQRIQTLFNQKQQQIEKQTSDALFLFIKLTQMIQNHTQQQRCILYHLKKQFILYLHQVYSNTSKNINESLQRNMNNDINQFIKFYRTTINDYYKIYLIQDLVKRQYFLFNAENFTNAITAILFKNQQFYQVVEKIYKYIERNHQQQIQKLLEEKKNITPEELDINFEYCLNKKTVEYYVQKLSIYSGLQNMDISTILEYQPYQKCILKLKQIKQTRSPIAKLKVIVSCAEKITQSIKQFYELNNLEVKKKIMVDADQVLSIFCYIFIKSRVKDIYIDLKIIQNFATEIQMMEITGYYYTVMSSAVENLIQKKNSLTSLKAITFGEQ